MEASGPTSLIASGQSDAQSDWDGIDDMDCYRELYITFRLENEELRLENDQLRSQLRENVDALTTANAAIDQLKNAITDPLHKIQISELHVNKSGSTSSIGQSDTQSNSVGNGAYYKKLCAERLENEELRLENKQLRSLLKGNVNDLTRAKAAIDQLKNAITDPLHKTQISELHVNKIKGRTGLWYIPDKTLHYVPAPLLEEGRDLEIIKNKDIQFYLQWFGKEILLDISTKYPSEEAKKNLKDLLSKYAPNLEKLVIRTGSGINSLDLSPLHLPKLKDLVFHGSKYLEMSKYILPAANNLQRLELPDHIDEHVLEMLEEVDKLHCLKKFGTTITSNLINYWLKSPNCENLKVESLELSYDECREGQLNVFAMLNPLLESSKDVIEELQMNFNVPSLPGLVIPKLKKLRSFCFHPKGSKARMIPSLVEIADVFPNLNEMSILDSADRCSGDYIPSQPMTQITSIEVLRIIGGPKTLISTEALMDNTPNVKTLHLGYIVENMTLDTSNIFRAIFKNLPKLETFELKIQTETATYRDFLFELVVAVSGLPKYFCKQMAEKLKNKDNLSADELAFIQSKSRYASILDLEVLKKLDINIHCKIGTEAYTGFTKLSQLLIFDFMPTVEVSINKSSGH